MSEIMDCSSYATDTELDEEIEDVFDDLSPRTQDLLRSLLSEDDNEASETFIDKTSATKSALLDLADVDIYHASMCENIEESLTYLEGAIREFEVLSGFKIEEPVLYLKLQMAKLQIQLGRSIEAKYLLQNGRDTMEAMYDIDLRVYSSFHWAWCCYHKHHKDFSLFYKSAMCYLAHTSLDSMTEKVRQDLPQELALSAILGDEICLGEVLSQPLIDALVGTWYHDVLISINEGDIDRYEELQHKDNFHHLVAKENSKRVLDKLNINRMLSTFAKDENRIIALDLIAKDIKASKEEVEFLLMKCFAEGLLDGTIDEVDGTVYVAKVKGKRYFNISTVQHMGERIDRWLEKVKMGLSVEPEAKLDEQNIHTALFEL